MEKLEGLSVNAKRNTEVLREEGHNALEFVKENTGIRNKGDMKKWAAGIIKLASLCISEFMKGYRKARDGEVDKMLHNYFQEFED